MTEVGAGEANSSPSGQNRCINLPPSCGSGSDGSSCMCVRWVMVSKCRKDSGIETQADNCTRKKKQTPVLSSSLCWVIASHCRASSFFLNSFVSMATQWEVNSGSLLLTAEPLT